MIPAKFYGGTKDKLVMGLRVYRNNVPEVLYFPLPKPLTLKTNDTFPIAPSILIEEYRLFQKLYKYGEIWEATYEFKKIRES